MVKPVLAATSAAPGVDQALITGILVRQESHRLSSAMARQIAVTQLAVSMRVAPTASAAAMISASVPPKPTIAATKAETGIDMRMLTTAPARSSLRPPPMSIARSCGRDSRWSPSGISDT